MYSVHHASGVQFLVKTMIKFNKLYTKLTIKTY